MNRDDRLDRLERWSKTLDEHLQELAIQLTEQMVRIRCTMDACKVQRKISPITGVNGEPQVEICTLYDAYMDGGRARTLAKMEQEMLAAEAIQKELSSSKFSASPDLADLVDPSGTPLASTH